jgi:hypothetical protein
MVSPELPADGAVEQSVDEWVGGRLLGQRVEVALHDGDGVILHHLGCPMVRFRHLIGL